MLLAFKTPIDPDFTYPNIGDPTTIIFEDKLNAIRIRTMSLADLVATKEKWIVAEGWPGIKYTLIASYMTDPEGFYLLEKNGEKVASISVVTYPEIQSAFLGFYCVVKPMRGQGYGKLIINKALEHAKNKRNITSFILNCVEAAIPAYEKLGFKFATKDSFWKLTKTTASENDNATEAATSISSLEDELFNAIVAYDADILKTKRKNFLQNFLLKPGTLTIIAQDHGKINGYGVISMRDPAIPEANNSYKIAPLFADNEEIAAKILKQLISILKINESAYLDMSSKHTRSASIVKANGFNVIGEQTRMFKGVAPYFDSDRIFCYTSIAIGG